jgi:hypothetical protein
VAGTFQGENGNNIATCQTRRGLILAGGAAPIVVDGTVAAAATSYGSDSYKGDSEHYKKHSDEYKRHDEDEYDSYQPKPFKGEMLMFSPTVVSCMNKHSQCS